MKQTIAILLVVLLSACTDMGKKADNAAFLERSDSAMAANGYEALPLFKTKTGHITVTLQVNGKPCVFLIDTGGGATFIDISKKDRYNLKAFPTKDYAAGIGSVSALVRTSAVININDHEEKADSLFLMDISYVNAEFKKNRARQVDGVLGTDFLERHDAVIDYARSRIYLKSR